MEWTVERNVADIVLTMYYVIMSVGSVREVVKTVILEHLVIILAQKDITAQTVPWFVHLTVNLIHVYTQTDHVLSVFQDGRVIIVLQYVSNLMEKTVGTHALRTVTIKHVTGSMDGVFGVVKMDFMVKCVKEAQ